MFNNKKRLFLLFDFLISVICFHLCCTNNCEGQKLCLKFLDYIIVYWVQIIISNISYGELLKTKEKIIWNVKPFMDFYFHLR